MTEAGWTREKPSKEGVYWFRWTENSNPRILSVAKDDCDWRVLEMGNQYDGALAGYSGGEWLGPITPDSYQQGRVAGLREAAEMVEDDCYIEGGELLPDYEHRCKHNVNQKELAGKIRFRAKLAQQAAQDEKGVGE